MKPTVPKTGSDCRRDEDHKLWGICDTNIKLATKCGMPGSCFDSAKCSKGCGLTKANDLVKLTCSQDSFCATILLLAGGDKSYTSMACGPQATTLSVLATATTTYTAESKLATTAAPEKMSTRTFGLPESTSTSQAASQTETQISTQTNSKPLSEAAASQTSTAVSSSKQGSDSKGNSSSNNTGAVVGGVVGGLAVVCGTVVAGLFLWSRGRKRRTDLEPVSSPCPQMEQAYTPVPKPETLSGGWGPQELPCIEGRHSPIELPA
ncbi:Fc.00g027630.m01.CDS01 [Cosmosporella sp. VM-42]